MKSLKKSILVLSLFAFVKMFGQTAPEVVFETVDRNTPIEEITYNYLLAHKVFLREKPSLKAKKLTILNIGTQLILREESPNSEEIEGIKSKWYRVETEAETGWVWGGMIAQKAFGSDADYEVKFVYGYESHVARDTGVVETKYQFRAFKNGMQVDKIVLDSLAAVPGQITNLGSKGLFNVEDIIAVDLLDPKTGADIGKSYIFWNNGKFTNVANLIDHSDASYSKTESFVFPSDMEGIKSTIALRTIIIDHKVTRENQWMQPNKTFRISAYVWNGYTLSEKEESPEILNDVVANNLNR